ncbi:uncharacterized protein VP01_780g6 [Puccinia sorghi]|uniref:Uncharacterized protein n=1 Tax=Puccinia sorghi TaxID=27349 RepID=A0A0L6UD92_9BASI|nr:uncharacterized protein VP01_780g6 [Puccinia sorghi]
MANIPHSFFCLPQNVSKHTILQAQKQLKLLESKKDLTETFSQMFNKESGIPFSHMIGEILEEHGPLEPEYFHPQWCLDYSSECEVQDDAPEFDLKEGISRLI